MGLIVENLKHFVRSRRYNFNILTAYLKATNNNVDEVYDCDLKQGNRIAIEWRDAEGILKTTVVELPEIEKLARKQKWDIY
jgi:hypothetical protein